jgi:hypothetical protein
VKKFLVTEEGRECAKCGVFKPWVEPDGRLNFWHNRFRANGHYSRCTECLSKRKARVPGRPNAVDFPVCIRCGVDLPLVSTSNVCASCQSKGRAWGSGVYLVVANQGDFTRLGHFTGGDFKCTLEVASFPSGMQVEHWDRRRYMGTYEVDGTHLVKIDAEPQGDGVYLIPTDDGEPAALGTPFVGRE